MKALLALRGSMREIDREHLLSLGYDVTWVENIESIRQIESTSLRDFFAAAALPCVHADGGRYGPEGAAQVAKYSYAIADALLAERAKYLTSKE